MSQIIKYLRVCLVLCAALAFMLATGCGTANDKAVYDADQGHPEGWVPAKHAQAAGEDMTVCAECHGADYSGGISGVSCTKCHLGGVDAVHPTLWGTGTGVAANHGMYVVSNGNTKCANAACHGTQLTGVDESGPSCTSCHLGGQASVHPSDWGTGTQLYQGHALYATEHGTAQCANAACHGSSLEGGVGPACSQCHTNGQNVMSCSSCHGTPPDGTVAPNRTGAHGGHYAALSGMTSVCDICHNGDGTMTANHFNNVVNVDIMDIYSAKSGTVVHNADGTCSNVSCHGGQTTPVWLTGSIDVATQCTSCHAYGSTEYNSYVSGQHDLHVNTLQFSCVVCHDTDKLAVNHFTKLNTSALEGPASATLNNTLNYDAGTCTPLCHGRDTWQ